MPKGPYNKNFINLNTNFSRSTFYRKVKSKNNSNSTNNNNKNISNDIDDDHVDSFESNYDINEIFSASLNNDDCNENINHVNDLIFDSELQDDFNAIQNENDTIVALICLYFSGKFTQTSFNIVLEFLKLNCKVQIPNTFNQLAETFLNLTNNKINFKCEAFCSNCSITKNEELLCNQCNSK